MIRPKHVIVTSNYHPEDIWSDDQITLSCILRRFTVIEKVIDDNIRIVFMDDKENEVPNIA